MGSNLICWSRIVTFLPPWKLVPSPPEKYRGHGGCPQKSLGGPGEPFREVTEEAAQVGQVKALRPCFSFSNHSHTPPFRHRARKKQRAIPFTVVDYPGSVNKISVNLFTVSY